MSGSTLSIFFPTCFVRELGVGSSIIHRIFLCLIFRFALIGVGVETAGGQRSQVQILGRRKLYQVASHPVELSGDQRANESDSRIDTPSALLLSRDASKATVPSEGTTDLVAISGFTMTPPQYFLHGRSRRTSRGC